MFTDYIFNGRGHGQVGALLEGVRYDPGFLRPYLVTENGRNIPYVTVTVGRHDDGKPIFNAFPVHELQARGIQSPVFNATSLRKEEWIRLDQKVVRAARRRLRFWKDIADANTYGGFNGMSVSLLEHETQSDPGVAIVDMDGLSNAPTNDSPKFQLEGLPLPITHVKFSYGLRRLSQSRNTGSPLDLSMGEAAGRRIAENIERTALGVDTGITYGGNSTQVGGYSRNSSVYGATNFPPRLTKTNMYRPTGNGRSGTGWVPQDTLLDVLAMRDAMYANKFYGPFMLYHSTDWDQYMDRDYILTGGNVATQTLRARLRMIGNDTTDADGADADQVIMGVKRLDFLSDVLDSGPAAIKTTFPFTMLLIQMTEEVVRAVVGMDLTTIQYETKGGMELNFMAFCIMVPQFRADHYGNCGVMHANASASPA